MPMIRFHVTLHTDYDITMDDQVQIGDNLIDAVMPVFSDATVTVTNEPIEP